MAIKRKQLPVWSGFVVVNAEDSILAVYGSALENDARDQRKALRAQFPLAVIEAYRVTCARRPHVRESLFGDAEPLTEGD